MSLVVIVGAGVAGLSAATALRESGFETLILEALPRVGGRARTVQLANGEPFDLGATWLHDADNNPLDAIARGLGEPVRSADGRRERRKYIGSRRATADEMRSFDETSDLFTETGEARLTGERDVSLAEATAGIADRFWAPTVAYWEACLIAAADPGELSLRDWHANQLDGRNHDVDGGIGAFVERRLAPTAGQVRLSAPVRHISWSGNGVTVTADGHTVEAAACIVTVSTGVLAAGGIRFDPPLPQSTSDAIDGLPMGLLTKVGLPVAGDERFGLPEGASVQRRVASPDEPMMSFHCFPFGHRFIAGFVGGPGAWALARQGDAATESFARSQLENAIGREAMVSVGPALVSDWAVDPAFLGSYAYARPGCFSARAALAEPVAEGRLMFAGEAARSDGYAGTVGGAWLSGQDAAASVAKFLRRRHARPTVAAAK